MLVVLVSHSVNFAKETKKYVSTLIAQIDPSLKVKIAAGLANGELGTSANLISEVIQESEEKDVIIVPDVGSAVINAVVAKEMVEGKNIKVSKGAFFEGLLNLAGCFSKKTTIDEALEALEEEIKK